MFEDEIRRILVDKETRLRILKDRQNEERQRKLEEIKAQALAAQKFKEQKEAERRKRLEELRLKDEQRRLQVDPKLSSRNSSNDAVKVEEKKRAINEAERNRLEFILKRNQEREQRIEAKKRNERSSAVFAFGSSTPRMLEPSDLTVSFWGNRRATSIQNITSAAQPSLTRRQSERDLDLAGKKRATSATGLERSTDGSEVVIPAGCASGYMGRRRTDLVPTIPSRDASFSSSRKSLNQSPGRAYSMSRLDQLARPRRPHVPPVTERGHQGGHATNPVTRSMSHLAINAPSSGGRLSLSRSVHHLPDAAGPPQRPVRTTRAVQLREQKMLAKATQAGNAVASSNCSEASSRPSSSLSQQSTNSVASSISVRHRISTTPRKPRPVSIAVTGISHDKIDKETKPPLPKMRSVSKTKDRMTPRKTSEDINKEKVTRDVVGEAKILEKAEKSKEEPKIGKTVEETQKNAAAVQKDVIHTEKAEPVSKPESQPIATETDTKEILNKTQKKELKEPEPPKIAEQPIPEPQEETTLVLESKEKGITDKDVKEKEQDEKELKEKINENEKPKSDEQENTLNAESSEMTTSLSKVRISTEEEAKAAIAEKRRRMREEAERQAELERQRLEAEAKAELERQQREEEQVRQLIEMQRQAEQERLQEAIREAQKREEEERLRKEEEQRLKLLKEEAERKAKEDAERQKAELQERLRNEEREREARRKRVEAIMLRTRGKNNANLTSQSTDEKNENKSDEGKVNEESKMNGTKIEQQENDTTNIDKQSEIVDNIMQEDIIKNANTIESMNKTDSINSNSAWRDSQQYGNFVCNNNS
ncbi:unnamed protein product [Acanthoscelides obtectus]|uniref:Uncharacterized protein n=1 Tax=Acanthoscelides obtectus TaxID=200917 RepID=A0A9P0K6G6_ACAOB|nr:unnamed protein product [Acanthoscelides obtectus]CAK1627499.1 hypothetical protein AOBTE_LOCUS4634 [Acanthoscelides obtectus]